jgi:glycosyltransferase involved in cell wall biosynthesis
VAKSLPSVSVFFPCYNDERTIGGLVRTADKILRLRGGKYEIIVIDDGSTDGSRKLLKKLAKEFSSLRPIFHRRNRGYGGALRSGFGKAKYDLVFYTDGDGQYDAGELKLMFGLMTLDIDVVNGIKMFRNDPWYRVVVGNIYNFFVRNLFGIDIFDTDCDFRLIRKSVLRKVDLKCKSGAICVELVKKLQDAGARFRQVSVHHYARKYGQSQFFNWRRILMTGWELVKLRLEL